MGEPEHRFARPSIQRARFVAAGVVVAAVGLAALAFMVAGVDNVEVLATLLFAPVVIAAIVGGRKLGYVAAVLATAAYFGLRVGDLEDSGTSRVLVLVAARAACFAVVAYATPLLADRVPSLARPTVSSGRHKSGKDAMEEWETAAPPPEYPLEDSFAFSEPVPAGEAPPQPPARWDEPVYGEDPYSAASQDPYGSAPMEPAAYAEDPYGPPAEDPYGSAPMEPAAYAEDPYGPPAEDSYGSAPMEPAAYAEDPYGPPAMEPPAPAPAPAWDGGQAVEPVANPWEAPPAPGAPGPSPYEWGTPGPAHEAEPEPAAAAGPSGWDSQSYMGSAAPSVPTGWIDDATVPLGDETIPVGYTGELFLPRELREHPLVEQGHGQGPLPLTNGNGSSNGGPRHHPAEPPPPQPPLSPSQPPPPPSPFAGEVSLSPPGPGPGAGPGARVGDTGPQPRLGDTGELHRGVDPETRLWNAHFFRDRLTQARDDSRRSGQPFSLVMVQVADEPFQSLPYRRQVALLRELGHQFVQARVLDHLVHLPDGAQHWFAVILPDTDSAGAHLVERRLRSAIAGYLRSRGLRIGDVQSASLTSPDDDEALASVWASLLGSTSV